MEVLFFQVIIFIIILFTASISKRARNITILVISVFTLLAVFTLKLAIVQFFTIAVAYFVSENIYNKKKK